MNSKVAGTFSPHVELNAFFHILRVSRVEGVVVALNNVNVVGH